MHTEQGIAKRSLAQGERIRCQIALQSADDELDTLAVDLRLAREAWERGDDGRASVHLSRAYDRVEALRGTTYHEEAWDDAQSLALRMYPQVRA
jgi:hypothetical protein